MLTFVEFIGLGFGGWQWTTMFHILGCANGLTIALLSLLHLPWLHTAKYLITNLPVSREFWTIFIYSSPPLSWKLAISCLYPNSLWPWKQAEAISSYIFCTKRQIGEHCLLCMSGKPPINSWSIDEIPFPFSEDHVQTNGQEEHLKLTISKEYK